LLRAADHYPTFTKARTLPEAMAVYLAASGRKVTILSILLILSKNKKANS
jgi:hypothetical protein